MKSDIEEFNEQPFLELFYNHQSEDFKKTRRNLMIISFVIISIYHLELPFNDLSILGLTLKDTGSKITICAIALTLNSYWLLMFEIYRKRDKEIQNRRDEIVHKKINICKEEIIDIETKILREQNARHTCLELKDKKKHLENILSQYKSFQRKNAPTLKLVLKIESWELNLPRILGAYSILILFVAWVRQTI